MKDTAIIEQAIQGGVEAVQKLIESTADRRVNEAVTTARQKWETELPEHVETELQRRAEAEEKQKAERLAVSQEIEQRFEGTGIDTDTWAALIDVDGFLTLEGDERTAKIDETTERVKTTIDRALKAKYRGYVPQASTGETSEEAFKSQLLENMR